MLIDKGHVLFSKVILVDSNGEQIKEPIKSFDTVTKKAVVFSQREDGGVKIYKDESDNTHIETEEKYFLDAYLVYKGTKERVLEKDMQ